MKKNTITTISAVVLLTLTSCGQNPAGSSKAVMSKSIVMPTSTETKDFGGFSINIPKGWQISQYGNCSDISFISWDPNHPDREFFQFGMVGPFYTDAGQKTINDQYTAISGQKTPLTGTPVIDPLTPENFLKQFIRIEEIPQVRAMFKKLPGLKNVQIISVTPQQSGITAVPSSAAVIRAVFTNETKTVASEGLFLVTVIPFQIPMAGPSARFGMAASFIGMSADINDFESVMPVLKKCLDEFTIQPSYVQNCMNDANAQWKGVQQAGKTLAEGSRSIMKAWENKNQSQDISSQKISDGILGRERLYDPQTKEVYTVSNEFIDKYNNERNKFNKPNLERLPANDHTLWNTRTQNGAENIRRID